MLRLKFTSFGCSFGDLNKPFYQVIMDPNTEYPIIKETEDAYYFKSSHDSEHKVLKTSDYIKVLDNKVLRLVYVLYLDGVETDKVFLSLQDIKEPEVSIFHEYKLMWKCI